MAKSKYEQAHEQDLRIIAETLSSAKIDYDLCDDGFQEVIEYLNTRLSKPLDIDLKTRKGGQITLEMDVSRVPVDYNHEMTGDDARRLEDILHEAAAGFLDSIGAQLDSTTLSTDLWHD